MEQSEVLTPDASVAPDLEASRPEPSREVAKLDVPDDVYRAMDAADEGQILDYLQGNPSKVMVYSFKGKDGSRQTGLSWEGVRECVRQINQQGFGQIRAAKDVDPLIEEIQEPDVKGELITYIRVMVYAEDAQTGGGNYGAAQQPKLQTYKDPNRKPTFDSFALSKGLSKAQRNAMEPLIPMRLKETLIAQMLGDETRVKQIRAGAGAEEVATLPPPLTDEKATALLGEIKSVFEEIQAVNRLALLPGKYHAMRSRTLHSHDEMESFLGFLRSLLERESQKAAS